jgi:hypothetical protein
LIASGSVPDSSSIAASSRALQPSPRPTALEVAHDKMTPNWFGEIDAAFAAAAQAFVLHQEPPALKSDGIPIGNWPPPQREQRATTAEPHLNRSLRFASG